MCDVCGCGQAAATRLVKIEEEVLQKNNAIAAAVRARLAERRALMINLLSAPGSGKTLLLEVSLPRLMAEVQVGVIEGDVQTRYDAERLRRVGIPAVQINTGGACHLDAVGVQRVLGEPPLTSADVIVIENVGNLVCPAAFDLGEQAKVVAVSVTEGDDKPEKYPAAFAVASLMLITKVDLLPYVNFDVARCKEGARQVHPGLPVIELSARTGEGVDAWVEWLRHQLAHVRDVPHTHNEHHSHAHRH
ncbi:MAG: hydrogenase nickel incorporation protein HypB [bacterium]|nr:hydrogenase nickel incorporation protein HypB [bacterium]